MITSGSAWLLARGVASTDWAYQIRSRRQTVGRAVDCHIHVVHESVSRCHAEVWRKAGTLFIHDLDSTNGTYVEGCRVTESTFSIGQTLRLGQLTLDVVSDPLAAISSAGVDASHDSGTSAALVASAGSGLMCAALTGSERQVLRLLLQGLSEKRVASSLSISQQTVHTHVKEIYRMLDVHSRAELLARFIAHTASDYAPVDVRSEHEDQKRWAK